MIAPEPPDHVEGVLERAAWVNAYGIAASRADWDAGFESGLAMLANTAAQYVRLVREGAERDGQPVAEELRETADQWRRITREWMAEYLLIEKVEISGGTLRADGLDADIAALCDVPMVQ
jgi:hypothetical protein